MNGGYSIESSAYCKSSSVARIGFWAGRSENIRSITEKRMKPTAMAMLPWMTESTHCFRMASN